MKKAQGLSMNVIIIAAIALIILVVLVVIFAGRSKIFSSTTTETTAQYTGHNCEIGGTNNRCEGNPAFCRQSGGSYNDGPYDDCPMGCCVL